MIECVAILFEQRTPSTPTSTHLQNHHHQTFQVPKMEESENLYKLYICWVSKPSILGYLLLEHVGDLSVSSLQVWWSRILKGEPVIDVKDLEARPFFFWGLFKKKRPSMLLLLLFPPTPRSRAFFQTYSPMEIGCLSAFRTLGVRFRASGGGGCFCSRFVH